jgi:hypothetical protein
MLAQTAYEGAKAMWAVKAAHISKPHLPNPEGVMKTDWEITKQNTWKTSTGNYRTIATK